MGKRGKHIWGEHPSSRVENRLRHNNTNGNLYGRSREQHDSSANGCFVMLLVFIALVVVGMIVN